MSLGEIPCVELSVFEEVESSSARYNLSVSFRATKLLIARPLVILRVEDCRKYLKVSSGVVVKKALVIRRTLVFSSWSILSFNLA